MLKVIVLNVVMLNVIVQNVFMLNVVVLSGIVLNVVLFSVAGQQLNHRQLMSSSRQTTFERHLWPKISLNR